MKGDQGFTFKIATEEWEFERIFELNYATFVEEVPQHDHNPSRRLVDMFHGENTYFICLKGNELAGMVALRDKRPFSLDKKLGSIDDYLPAGSRVCEIRLLSVAKERRKGRVIQGLLSLLARRCIEVGYDIAVISGNVTQQRLYRGLGFVPFGPIVGTPDASFQPMYRRLENLEQDLMRLIHPSAGRNGEQSINFMPGPVAISPNVKRAYERAPVSHRSPHFVKDVQRTRRRLCKLVAARSVEILLGSGTMANDAVAAQLSLEAGRGLILSNGEFGERLLDHAARMGLDFDAFEQEWGRPFDYTSLQSTICNGSYSWLWAVHCETSTGILNDISFIKMCCVRKEVKLALDCISSIGTLPIDLSGVFLASGVSGKGLGSYSGLSLVFHDHDLEPRPDCLPRCLDIGLHAANNGVPFTMSSNLVYALDTALDRLDSARPFDEVDELSSRLRERLRDLGFRILATDSDAAPAVITLALPSNMSASELGNRLEQNGFLLSYNSEYLRERNWIQICLMGDFSKSDVESLVESLTDAMEPVGPA